MLSARQIKNALRDGPYAWPGGYPRFFRPTDGEALTFRTVRAELKTILQSTKHKLHDGWTLEAVDVNWEDANLFDAHTNERIENAYSG